MREYIKTRALNAPEPPRFAPSVECYTSCMGYPQWRGVGVRKIILVHGVSSYELTHWAKT